MKRQEAEMSKEDQLIALAQKYKLPCCGCGDPQGALHAYRFALQQSEKGDGLYGHLAQIYREDLEYVLAYVLDTAGLTEHGSGVMGCWLTAKGKKFLEEYAEIVAHESWPLL